MASKLAAAQMASWAGVTTTIAAATQVNIVIDALQKKTDIGTTIHPHPKPLSARKLWIAFALETKGKITIDKGAQRAIIEEGGSLLSVGIIKAEGEFDESDAVEILNIEGETIARGLSSIDSHSLNEVLSRKPDELRGIKSNEIIHRDQLVLLVG